MNNTAAWLLHPMAAVHLAETHHRVPPPPLQCFFVFFSCPQERHSKLTGESLIRITSGGEALVKTGRKKKKRKKRCVGGVQVQISDTAPPLDVELMIDCGSIKTKRLPVIIRRALLRL